MKCADLEILLCDYTDGTLDAPAKASLERHLEECPACAELARDAAAAIGFLARVAAIEPPAELVTRILFQIPNRRPSDERRRGIREWTRRWFEPILQPRLAMGMAMTMEPQLLPASCRMRATPACISLGTFGPTSVP